MMKTKTTADTQDLTRRRDEIQKQIESLLQHGGEISEVVVPTLLEKRAELDEILGAEPEKRWDVVFPASGNVAIEKHFCRDADCHGNNPLHGLAWGEAVSVVVDYYESMAAGWRKKEEP